MQRSLDDLVRAFELSRYRENTFEQLFCAELLQAAWVAGYPPFEIDRPFVDFAGYDLVITCGPVTRHIQLKATRGVVSVQIGLGDKPSGCVLNLRPLVAGEPPRIAFRYHLAAGAPGEPLDLTGFKKARKTYNTRQPDGTTRKEERVKHVVVPSNRFKKNLDINTLLIELFGPPGAYGQPDL